MANSTISSAITPNETTDADVLEENMVQALGNLVCASVHKTTAVETLTVANKTLAEKLTSSRGRSPSCMASFRRWQVLPAPLCSESQPLIMTPPASPLTQMGTAGLTGTRCAWGTTVARVPHARKATMKDQPAMTSAGVKLGGQTGMGKPLSVDGTSQQGVHFKSYLLTL